MVRPAGERYVGVLFLAGAGAHAAWGGRRGVRRGSGGAAVRGRAGGVGAGTWWWRWWRSGATTTPIAAPGRRSRGRWYRRLTIPCSSLASGQIGSGQSVATLATAELSGTTDAWTSYVELSPATHFVFNYNLPSGVAAGTITSLSVDVNVRGPTLTEQPWTYQVLDTTTGSWVALGNNSFATSWVWTKHTFTFPAPLARFFSSAGLLQIRYGTDSNADASDLDQLLIRGTSDTGTTGSAGTTGTAGTTGSAGTTGAAGTTAGAAPPARRHAGWRRHDRHAGTTGSAGRGGTTGTAGTAGAHGRKHAVLDGLQIAGERHDRLRVNRSRRWPPPSSPARGRLDELRRARPRRRRSSATTTYRRACRPAR